MSRHHVSRSYLRAGRCRHHCTSAAYSPSQLNMIRRHDACWQSMVRADDFGVSAHLQNLPQQTKVRGNISVSKLKDVQYKGITLQIRLLIIIAGCRGCKE